jgi:hypothetical protein
MDRNLTNGLRFYQHLSVGLENIYDLTAGQGPSDIQAALEAQFKSNLMLRGYDSWNVPLHRSLNSMPPQSQSSALETGPSQEITSIQPLPATDFVLTASSHDAAVNIWVTKAGLTRVHALNFKWQAEIQPGDSLRRAQLDFLTFEAEERSSGVKVFIPRVEQKAALELCELTESGQDPGDGEYMAALFDEEAAADLEAEEADPDSTSSISTDQPEED